MMLYHFNPNTWGSEWYVMSESKEEAIEQFNRVQIKLFTEEVELEKRLDKRRKRFGNPPKWGDKQFERYTIDEYGPNQIIESEIA